MADSFTAKLNLTKPEVGASTDTWGTKLNADLDTIDGLFDTGPYLKVAKGGTGAGTAGDARTNLGLGDLAVEDTVSTALVDDAAITYAKIQNVSATSRVLGRKTSGAGSAEELTLSEVLDLVGSAAQGDILYRGASSWTRLGAGTAGQYLKTNGSGDNPAWATVPSPTTYLLFQQALPSASSYTIDSSVITSTFSRIEVLFDGVSHNSTSQAIQMQISGDNGSNYCTAFTIAPGPSGSEPMDGYIVFHKANETSNTARLYEFSVFVTGDGLSKEVSETSAISGAINNIKLSVTAGSFDAGKITVIGYA